MSLKCERETDYFEAKTVSDKIRAAQELDADVHEGEIFRGDLLLMVRVLQQPEDNRARKIKDLECENARLRRPVTDLSLEKQVLSDVVPENLFST